MWELDIGQVSLQFPVHLSNRIDHVTAKVLPLTIYPIHPINYIHSYNDILYLFFDVISQKHTFDDLACLEWKTVVSFPLFLYCTLIWFRKSWKRNCIWYPFRLIEICPIFLEYEAMWNDCLYFDCKLSNFQWVNGCYVYAMPNLSLIIVLIFLICQTTVYSLIFRKGTEMLQYSYLYTDTHIIMGNNDCFISLTCQ